MGRGVQPRPSCFGLQNGACVRPFPGPCLASWPGARRSRLRICARLWCCQRRSAHITHAWWAGHPRLHFADAHAHPTDANRPGSFCTSTRQSRRTAGQPPDRAWRASASTGAAATEPAGTGGSLPCRSRCGRPASAASATGGGSPQKARGSGQGKKFQKPQGQKIQEGPKGRRTAAKTCRG